MQFETLTNNELGNGDPVIAYANGNAIPLVTWFDGWDDCFREVEYAVKNGKPGGWSITPERAAQLEGAEEVMLFTPEAIEKA